MKPSLDVVLSPAEFTAFQGRSLADTTCVVFDILRATTTMVTALGHGADAIIPVAEITEALAWKARRPEVLLGGERHGVRIDRSLTDSIDFDLGNSPAEYSREKVQGRIIVMTTTNGTRALRACRPARQTYLGSFLNLRATAHRLLRKPPASLLLVCSGTGAHPALEDILAAGALCEKVWPHYAGSLASDAPEIARRLHGHLGRNLPDAMRFTSNGRRLLGLPELRDDVLRCVQRETSSTVAVMDGAGWVRRAD